MRMTEADWLACSKATQPVMDWLRRRGSERKFYLVAAAVLRHFWDLFPDDRYRKLVGFVERFADGEMSGEELSRAHRDAMGDALHRELVLPGMGRARRVSPSRLQAAAAMVAAHSSMPEGGWQSACNAIAESIRLAKRADLWLWQCALLRDIFGNPFRPVTVEPAWRAWNDGTVPKLAQLIYDDRRVGDLPVLADALEDAGCTHADVLNHCRQPAEHVRGCWVIDLLLQKE